MSMQDLMSDFVARINNAVKANSPETVVLKNKLVLSVVNKLTKLGYFVSYTETEKNIEVLVNLQKLSKIKRISKPGLRQYSSSKDKFKISGGKGYILLTTSKGVKTHIEARDENLGGEVLCQVI